MSSSPECVEARQGLARLTDGEREVATLVSQGLSNAELAQRRHVSESTVKTQLSSIQTKLGVDNRIQVAVLVALASV